jgi:hypothetical protein
MLSGGDAEELFAVLLLLLLPPAPPLPETTRVPRETETLPLASGNRADPAIRKLASTLADKLPRARMSSALASILMPSELSAFATRSSHCDVDDEDDGEEDDEYVPSYGADDDPDRRRHRGRLCCSFALEDEDETETDDVDVDVEVSGSAPRALMVPRRPTRASRLSTCTTPSFNRAWVLTDAR